MIGSRATPRGGTWLFAALVFMLLYNVAPRGMESLTSGRVAILALIVMAVWTRVNPLPQLKSLVLLPLAWLPIALAQSVLTGDYGLVSRFVNLAIYAYLGGALIAALSGGPMPLLRALLAAITVQSLVIFFSFFSLDYRAWFDVAVASSANYDPLYLYRAPGLSSDGGAALSVIQSLGVLVAWLLARRPADEEGAVAPPVLLVAALLALLSCILVGRTGLLLSMLFALPLLACTLRTHPRWTFGLLLGLITLLGLGTQALLTLLGQDFSIDYFLTWAFGFFTGQDTTLEFLAELPIPPVTLDTFFGTGQVTLKDGSNPSGHDSGFVQTYFGLGLLATVPFYLCYFIALLVAGHWLPLVPRVALAVTFFALEAKEPFLFKYAMPLVILALGFVHARHPVAAKVNRESDADRPAGQFA